MIILKDLKKGIRLSNEELQAIENRLTEVEKLFADNLPEDIEHNLIEELLNYIDIVKVSMAIGSMEDNGIEIIH